LSRIDQPDNWQALARAVCAETDPQKLKTLVQKLVEALDRERPNSKSASEFPKKALEMRSPKSRGKARAIGDEANLSSDDSGIQTGKKGKAC
jgi:hypothetical protein